MTNIELTQLAAKAIGNVPDGFSPLTDDGDALRLAIRLGMKLSTNLHHRFVVVNDEQEFYDEAKFGGVCDPEGVMRLTIVRVAAEIGRQMQEGGAAMRCAYTKEEVRGALLEALTRIRALPVHADAIRMAHKHAEEAIAKAAKGEA